MEKGKAEPENLSPVQDDGINTLPDWKKIEKPFEKIAGLNLEDDVKDAIILWWKENPQTLQTLASLKEVSTSINLPKNEAREATTTYESAVEQLKAINDSLLAFIGEEDKKKGLINDVLEIYAQTYHLSHDENEARKISSAVDKYDDSKENIELTIAIAKAIIDTRGENPDDNMFRKKAAQQVFQEMFDQMAIARIGAVHDIDTEISGIIDSPKSEQIDLTSAFREKTWTGDKRKKMLVNYSKLKRVLNKLEADTDQKTGLNTLWRWANGILPRDASVFKILKFADDLDEAITDTVAEAWQAEAERLEDQNDEENS